MSIADSVIPTSTSTADSKATNGIIFGLAFGIGIPVIVVGLAVMLVFLKYQYHKKKATTNWYAHNNQTAILLNLLCIRMGKATNIMDKASTSIHLSSITSNLYSNGGIAVLNFCLIR